MFECQAMIEPQGQKRGINMTFPQFDRPCFVDADRTRLKQVLINLLSNAIKYNQANGTVVVEVDRVSGNPERIRVSVRDTGAGLPPDMLVQLFQPFNRLGQERSAEEGTGIGLVMSKRLVELMGGEIGVESTVGIGQRVLVRAELGRGAAAGGRHSRTRGRSASAGSARRAAAHPALCGGQPGQPEADRATHRAPPGYAPAERARRRPGHPAGARPTSRK